MQEAINQSITKLCFDILGEEIKTGKSLGKGFYGASIPLTENNKEMHYYLFLKRHTLNEFAHKLLSDNDLKEDDLSDLCKEIINLIVGQAKTSLLEKYTKNSYRLGTPEYLGKVSYPFPIKLDESKIYKLKNRTFLLGVKKSD